MTQCEIPTPFPVLHIATPSFPSDSLHHVGPFTSHKAKNTQIYK